MAKKPRKPNIFLTPLEAEALSDTAGQMRDDIDYYNFLPRAQFLRFKAAYKSGLEKLDAIKKSSN